MAVSDFLDSLNLGELEFFEEESGLSIGDVYENGFIGKATVYLITILRQRTDPKFTLEDARKLNPVAAYDEVSSYNPKEASEA